MTSANSIRHFLDLTDIPKAELRGMIESSRAMKARRQKSRIGNPRPLEGRMLALQTPAEAEQLRIALEACRQALRQPSAGVARARPPGTN